jgi:DUF4097 and DUF4098 domain-containing protein YvlB
MSSYPPPPPPPNATPYDRAAWKNQRRAWLAQQKAYASQAKAQARLQRSQFRAQSRAARRGSLVGPLLLVSLGVIFLMTQAGSLSWGHAMDWYSRWWPAVLIGAGLLLMAEWSLARQRQAAGYTTSAPILGGGLVVLLIVLACIGLGLRFTNESDNQWHRWFSSDFGPMLGEVHEADDSASNTIAPGQPLVIRCPHGDVTVTGSSTDGQVHLSTHKQVHAWNDSQADSRLDSLHPQFSNGNQLVLSVNALEGGQADLTLEVPHDTPVTVEDGHGDITINELHAPVTLTANQGSVEMSGIDGIVQVHMNFDDGSVTGHGMTGPVTVQGRSGDINFSDITGPVALEGDFFGSTHLERVNGVVRFQTSRTQFEAQRLDGEFEVDTGADLQASEVLGPVNLTTRNRNIELDRVSGHVQITNRNGSVTVTNAPPFAGLQITNSRGSVDVGVPSGASFVLSAQTRHGDVDGGDFGISQSGSDDAPTLKGDIGNGGPLVSIITSDGDVTVRKSVAEPLPPAPPAPPKVTIATPAPPAAPAKPAKPAKAAKPAKPAAPATPAPPAK